MLPAYTSPQPRARSAGVGSEGHYEVLVVDVERVGGASGGFLIAGAGRPTFMRTSLLTLLMFLAPTGALTAAERSITYQCAGLEAYEIRGTHDVDWTWGTIRAKARDVTIGFSAGPMVEELVPAVRPPGFRTFKAEKLGRVVMRSGFNVRRNGMEVTLLGAPISSRINLIGRAKNRTELLAIARVLATARCK